METSGLTPFAWAFMLLSMGAVTALAAFCYYNILTGSPPAEPEESEGDSSSPPLVM